jgi:Na+-transporting NADH:ubiquinone oxidoreductase subunit F
MAVVLLGVAMFTGVIVSLVALVNFVRKRLVPEGDVILLINDEPGHALSVPAGQTLLSALSSKKVMVPSACGGKGTCGLCKVHVEGGGEALPTEQPFFTRGDLLRGSRLACQVKVKTDLKVYVASEAFNAGEWTCKVVSNESVADFIKELVLELPAGEEVPFSAGQYVQIRCPPYRLAYKDLDIPERFRKSWDRMGLWRHVSICEEPTERAYSMASYPQEKGILKFDIKIAPPPTGAPEGTPPGIVSSYLFSLKPGDELSLFGPFGEFCATDTDTEMIFIGGGAGMAPLRSIIFDQLVRLQTRRKLSYWYRAHSLRDALYREDFEALARERENFSWHLCLSKPEPEDQWTGYAGYIHNFIHDSYLKDHAAPEDCEYFLCGPRALSVGVLQLLHDLGVDQESIFYDNFAGEERITSH